MKDNSRYIIRRTLSQERFEVLWTKRKNGNATLKDLAEMDEIINRDAGVRRFVLEEMSNEELTDQNGAGLSSEAKQHEKFKGVFSWLKSLLNAVFDDKARTRNIVFPFSY